MPRAAFSIHTVCHGNICRSPMAATVLRQQLHDADLAVRVDVASSGVSAEERGNPIDARAARALQRRGYRVDGTHRAHRITDSELREVDLIVPATYWQMEELIRRGADPTRVRLMRWFDPALAGMRPSRRMDLEDPWYGGAEDFEIALDQIEAAAPGVVEYVRGLV
ncbi:MAG: low molecular weight phosphotyrosine protein phosphatase [Bifidobacteriaceae bacterium]|jgi:protein-tyrosine phosphatase|nr:low molecular weight phosphotyrosine protein phosphatase [Bifidobacteriaceae bacterium]